MIITQSYLLTLSESRPIMTTSTEMHGAIILQDGLPIGQSHDPESWLLHYQGQSVSYALEHGGFTIETRPAVVTGWMDFLTIAGRRGYGVNGYIVRSAVTLQSVTWGSSLAFSTEDRIATDYVITPALSAIMHALDYATGPLSLVCGELSSWAELVAARYGITEIP